MSPDLSKDEIRARWEIGDLSYKLRPYQRAVYDAIWDAIIDDDVEVFSVLMPRRFGKTFILRLIGCEFSIRAPESNINIGGPIGKEMKKINQTVMREILRDCPADLKPSYNKSDGTYEFPNGSNMFTAGLNNGHEDDQRGNDADLNLLDECGFLDNFEYVLKDVYAPQTDTSGGTTVLSTTPPKTPAHEFCDVWAGLEVSGHTVRRTVHDTDYTEARKAAIAKRCGGEQSTTWKREYLTQFVVDEELQVVPEWNDSLQADVERCEFWPFWHKYDAMDLGVRDLQANLFGYYDFRRACLVIEDEWIGKGHSLTTELIAEAVKEKERDLGYEDVYLRVSDNNNLLLINDLRAIHGLNFVATSKDELPAMVNELRVMVGQSRIKVHSRCKNLLGCLKYGVWKGPDWIGRELGRSSKYGHYDALMALVYLVRNLDTWTNPIPATHGLEHGRHYIPAELLQKQNESARELAAAFAPLRVKR